MLFLLKWLVPRETEFVVSSQKYVKKYVGRRLPQGAVLSPVLYALYTNEITKGVTNDINVLQFADDIAIYISSNSRINNRILLEVAIDKVRKNLEMLGLSLEPKKTNLVEFSKTGFDRNQYIKIKGTKIMNQRSAKFLGVWFDNHLSFSKHITEIRGKVNKANSLLRYLGGVSRGIEVNTSLMLYKSLVRSIMDYGSFVYAPNNYNLQLKLERGQFLGIRTALGYRNSTPKNVIMAESKIMYIRDRALMLAKNLCIKIFKYGENTIRNSLCLLRERELYANYRNPATCRSVIGKAWDHIMVNRKKVGSPLDTFELWNMSYKQITDRIDYDEEIGETIKILKPNKIPCNSNDIKSYNYQDINLIREVQHKYELSENSLIIYTDGSSGEQCTSVGAGLVFEEHEIGYYISLPKQCSIFSAEAFAIKTAMELAMNKSIDRDNVIIFSDCKSVLQALKNNRLDVYQNKYILEIKRLHSRFKKSTNNKKKMIFVWIPSHRGLTGNELADMLAKQGAEEPASSEIEIPISDLRRFYKEESWSLTQEKIKNEFRYKGMFYYNNYYNKNSKKPWFSSMNTERYFVTLINRLRANHYNLNASLARKNYIPDSRCECGAESEDFDHLVWQCHRYNADRIDMGIQLYRRNIDGVESITELIRKENWKKLYVIYKFVKKTGRVI
ncbi:uncharacterized protein LOC118645672 [Monomorium pharaonis]|uniref:uncharacterized protein LOC118645672 n=1 Tax=Monomorium pharaonis TaxID=307658 RepID=UPI0017471B09|nr:uncharacterized protein LOC118645672 [Monomorium pharaonis]